MSMMSGMINTNVKTYGSRRADGTASGTNRVKRSKKTKKLKTFRYNYKEISERILRSKTSESAKKTVTMARYKTVMLRRKLLTGDYNDDDLRRAITHAERLERIAKKKMKHLLVEEEMKRECDEKSNDELQARDDFPKRTAAEDLGEELQDTGRRKLEQLIKEMERILEETSEEILDDEELFSNEELLSFSENIKPSDLDHLKKKNRSKEMREIMEADLKYLKAVFEKLEREKQELNNFSNNAAVALEIGGIEMPVQTATVQDAPVMAEGANMDVSV